MYKHRINKIEDSFHAYLVQGAMFTPVEEYPILEKSMISKELPKTIIPFEAISRYKGNRKDVYVCTCERDKVFECIRRNPLKYIGLFKQFGGIIGLDFSIHSDMPIVKQKSQMYDNL